MNDTIKNRIMLQGDINMDLLEKLNPMQREAVVTTERPRFFSQAEARGKTRVLTHRIAYLIEKGVKGFNIIAITFTNKASKEMRERVNALVTDKNDIWVSTFHSACVRILRMEINRIGYDSNFTIYDSDDSEKLIKTLIKELNINDKQFPAKAVMSEIGDAKDELVGPATYEKNNSNDFRLSVISKIYKAYQKRLKDNNALDFDDIIFKTVELFITCPDVLEKYQNRFKYVMVDEYQDTNTSQYTLVRMLSNKYKNLCVVGDDDQSIYGWRGANIRNILDFEKDFPNAITIKLEQNYRSTKNILEAANAVIKNNETRKDKKLWTDHEDGLPINIFNAVTDLDEAAYVTDEIHKAKVNGQKLSDFAILYRTNAQSRVVEDSFVRNNIPYRIFGGLRFYERREIKDMLAYLRILYNPLDDIAIKRVINIPKRGIGETTVDKISAYAEENDTSFFDCLKNIDSFFGASARNSKIKEFVVLMEKLTEISMTMSVSELIQLVFEQTGYSNHLTLITKGEVDDSKDRVENINQLIAKAIEFEKQSESKLLSAFLEEVALVADIDNYKEGEETAVLMTLHSSKGLEFPTVFLVGFEENIFPSYRSVCSASIGDLEEERRLCYVGITRARECLHITMAQRRMQFGKTVANAPSRFLKEIPNKLTVGEVVTRKISDNLLDNLGSDFKIKEHKSLNVKSTLSETYKPVGFGGKSYANNAEMPTPKNVTLDFQVGDSVRQMKYGVGTVLDIKPAGADFEVTVEFVNIGSKKFMAHLSKLSKIE